MKRKNFFAILSLLVSASILTACTNNTQKVQFSEYWHKDMNIPATTVLEELTYTVMTNASQESATTNYLVDYAGTYVTKLEKEGANYIYSTTLSVTVVYNYKTGKSPALQDTVTSKVVFQNSANALNPVYSEKEIVCHAPIRGNIDASTDFNGLKTHTKAVVDYAENKSTVYNLLKAENESGYKAEDKIEINEKDAKKYTYLDNEQLLFALRGINPTTTTSPTLLVYAPYSETVQKIKATINSLSVADDFTFYSVDEDKQITDDISYYPITLSIDAKNSGQSHLAWFAKTTDANNNKYRNVMLKYQAPLSYGLGSLVYTLTQANFIG